MSSVRLSTGFVLAGMLLASGAQAGDADVLDVRVRSHGDSRFSFDVTVRHADTGWDHYANVWEVVAPDGTVLGTRTLHHPHVNEQPFTRSLSRVTVPEGVETVTIRAGDSVHGFGGKTVPVALPR